MRCAIASCAVLTACRLGFDDAAVLVVSDAAAVDVAIDATPDASPLTTTLAIGNRGGGNVTMDTWLDSSQPTASYGGADDVSVTDSDRVVIRFDLSSITPGTPIAGARLELVRVDYGDERQGELSVHPLTQSWVEGDEPIGITPGATWLTRDGTNAWSTAGAPHSGAIGASVPADPTVFVLNKTVVQGWINSPATNLGMLIKPTNDSGVPHYHFFTRNVAVAANRPQLVIELPP